MGTAALLHAAPLALLATPRSVAGKLPTNAAPTPTRWLMGWHDADAPFSPPPLRTWESTGLDPTGAQYAGPKSGATPIADAVALTPLPRPSAP